MENLENFISFGKLYNSQNWQTQKVDILDYFKNYQPQFFKLPNRGDEQYKNKIKNIKRQQLLSCIVGNLKNGKRSNETLISRSAIALDLDYIDPNITTRSELEHQLNALINVPFIVYPSVSCYVNGLRFHLIIPFDFNCKSESNYKKVLALYNESLLKNHIITKADSANKNWSQAIALPVVTDLFSENEKKNPIHIFNCDDEFWSKELFEAAVTMYDNTHRKPQRQASQAAAKSYVETSLPNSKDKLELFKTFAARNCEWLNDYNNYMNCFFRIKKIELAYKQLTHNEAISAIKILANGNSSWEKDNEKAYEHSKVNLANIDDSTGNQGLSYFVPLDVVPEELSWVYYNEKKKLCCNQERLAKEVVEEYHVTRGNTQNQIAVWDNNRWIFDNIDGFLKKVLYDKLENAGFVNFDRIIDRTYKQIINLSYQSKDFLTIFENPKDEHHAMLVQFANGTLDVDNWEFSDEINPDNHIPTIHEFKIPFKSQPKMPILTYEWICALTGNDMQAARFLMAYIGSGFTRKLAVSRNNTRMDWILLLYGEKGQNGKTAFLNFVADCLGLKNVASLTLSQLTKSKFSLANLAHKEVNIAGDLSYTSYSESGILKSITGGDLINAEVKNVQNAKEFVSYATMFFSANKKPMINDSSAGLKRRLVCIEFPQVINDEFAKKYPLSEIYKEIPKFVVYCLYQYHLFLIEQENPFEFSKKMKLQTNDWANEGDSASKFVASYLTFDKKRFENNDGETVNNIYNIYKYVAKENGEKAISKKNFEERLTLCFPQAQKKRARGSKDRNVWRWLGIILNDDFFNDFEESYLFDTTNHQIDVQWQSVIGFSKMLAISHHSSSENIENFSETQDYPY